MAALPHYHYKFKVGQKVKHKEQGWSATVDEPSNWNDVPSYWVKTDQFNGSRWHELETSLVSIDDLPVGAVTLQSNKANGCECGAWATSFPENHSHWCAKHR